MFLRSNCPLSISFFFAMGCMVGAGASDKAITAESLPAKVKSELNSDSPSEFILADKEWFNWGSSVVKGDNGTIWKPDRMERPFVLTDDKGDAQILFAACKSGNRSFNIAIPLTSHGD